MNYCVLCYSISPPGEFCTSRFAVSPENHVFPLSFLGKSFGIRTTVQLLPRLPEIPIPICHELHSPSTGLPSSRLADNEDSRKPGARMKSPEPDSSEYSSSSLCATSPRFTKPNVLNHEPTTQKAGVASADRCLCPCSECRFSSAHRDCIPVRHGQHGTPRTLRSPESPDLSCSNGSKELGAVPKCVLNNSSTASSVAAANAFEAENSLSLKTFLSYDDYSVRTNRAVKSPERRMDILSSSPQLPGSVTASKPMTLEGPYRHVVPRKHAGILKDTTDSSSSSPDIDAYLMKTMSGSRCDPMSPQEMDVYLNGLYRHHVRKVKSVSESRFAEEDGEIGDCSISVYGLQVDQQQLRKMPCKVSKFIDEVDRYPSKNAGYVTPKTDQMHGPAEAKQRLSETIGKESARAVCCNGYTDCISELTDGDSVFADVVDSVDNTGNSSAVLLGNGRAASRRLFEVDLDQQCHAKFQVGSEFPENGSNAEPSSAADPPPSNPKKIPTVHPSSSQGPLAIHKSVSCPNKKAFGVTAGLQKAGSLLKSVMKKELQHSAAVPEVTVQLWLHRTVKCYCMNLFRWYS